MELHATPYGYYEKYCGFYFQSMKQFTEKFSYWNKKKGCEEYEIQFIDGTASEKAVFNCINCRQGNLEKLFEETEKEYTDDKLAKLEYLTQYSGLSYDDAKAKLEDVMLFEGEAIDYVHEFVDECYNDMPEFCKRYFDHDMFLTDLKCNSEIYEFRSFGKKWTVTNALQV